MIHVSRLLQQLSMLAIAVALQVTAVAARKSSRLSDMILALGITENSSRSRKSP